MIKIIAVIRSRVQLGGACNQALSAILRLNTLSEGCFIFEVFTTDQNNSIFLSTLGINSTVFKVRLLDRFLIYLAQNTFWSALQSRLKLIGPFEQKLNKHKCDLVYFVDSSNLPASLQKLNYITTIFDVSHRETPEFPEVRSFNEYRMRDKHYFQNIASSILVITESVHLAERASKYYGFDLDRFLPIPLSPSPFLKSKTANSSNYVLNRYKLQPGFFFYPAQFWSHKNHIRILQALVILRNQYGIHPNVVFCGADHGNLKHITRYISHANLITQVNILGFIPSEDIRGLYQNSSAVIMPTYFGPTNIPPLEAWEMEIPLIYSAHLVEQVKDAAILVDPDDPVDIAKAMIKCTNLEIRSELIKAGKIRLEELTNARVMAENKLVDAIYKFARKRECWH